MAQSLTPIVVQRLAYSRFLYEEGVAESRRPAPLSGKALLSFHDAVENFLGLAADFLGVNVKSGISFIEYWGQLKSTVDLPGKTAMNKLNNARVALKHHGNFPSPQTIEQSRADVLNFFTTATAKVFNVDFDTVDMADLVTQSETARLLREAQTHADVADNIAAMAGLSLAFEALLEHYSGGGSSYAWQQTPFSFGPPLRFSDRPRRPEDDTEKGLVKVMDIVEETQAAMRMISLGIDYARYTRFAVHAPRVHGYMDGSHRYTVAKSDESLSTEDYASSRQFVIESALQAARADGIQELLDAQMKSNWNPKKPFAERTWTGPADTT